MSKMTKIYGLDGEEREEVELPDVFSVRPRLELVERAVAAIESAEKQPQGRDPLAGKRNTAQSWGTGYAMARIPRIRGSGFPTARNAGFAPGVVGGRIAHPPRMEKKKKKKNKKKEKRKALFSAISATGDKSLVKSRNHKVDAVKHIPLIIDDKFENIKKTGQVYDILVQLGLEDELKRAKEKRVRAGKGKRRGRKYKRKRGPLIVVKDDLGIHRAARNIPGVEVIEVKNVSCADLAPGTHAGRLTIWTQSALKALNTFNDEVIV